MSEFIICVIASSNTLVIVNPFRVQYSLNALNNSGSQRKLTAFLGDAGFSVVGITPLSMFSMGVGTTAGWVPV